MKLILENTSEIVTVNGVPARVWQGKTGNGVPVQVLITRIAVEKSEDGSEFERELTETPPPRVDGPRVFDARLVID